MPRETRVDLNYLYQRQQVELMRAEAATCSSSRRSHSDLADLFGEMIEGTKERARERAGTR